MALGTPTTVQLEAAIITQLEASLGQTIPLLPKAFLRVLAKALAAVYILLYKYCGFIALQMFVKTATLEDVEINGQTVSPLKEWGRLVGAGDPTAPTSAELDIDITVTTQGGTLPASTQLTSNLNGVIYTTKTSTALSSATVSATIIAVSEPGTVGNLDVGSAVSFVNPVADVARDAEVTAQAVTAADGETPPAYRQRVIDRFQKRPQGGATADYEAWGEEVEGIVSVYPYAGATPGEVDVYAEATVASSGDPDGIPTSAQLTAVADAIEQDQDGLATRRPLTAYVNTYPITRQGFDVSVYGMIVDNEAQVQQDIEDGLTAFFLARDPFIDGLTTPPRTDSITASNITGIVDDYVSAASGTFTSAVVTFHGSSIPITTYIMTQGQKAKLDTMSFS